MTRRPLTAKTRSAPVAPDPRRELGDRWRHDNVGRLLNNAVSRFESRVLELMSHSGHPQARISHISLTRNLDLKGTRVSELARRAGMTKQAMGELVSQCAALKLVVMSATLGQACPRRPVHTRGTSMAGGVSVRRRPSGT